MNMRLGFLLAVTLVVVGLAAAQERGGFVAANDAARVQRTGDWRWTSHRYALEAALATHQDGAAVELSARGRGVVLCLDTLTPPNNYGPPELGLLDVYVDDVLTQTIRPRESAGEVVLVRTEEPQLRKVRVAHRVDAGMSGVRIRGFRTLQAPTGDLAFVVSGEREAGLVDVRAVLTQKGQVVWDGLLRNPFTGACRIAGLPPGDDYELEVRAVGWRPWRTKSISVFVGRESAIAPVYMARESDLPQDAFVYPIPGHPVVRRPGEAFRARFEGHRAEIKRVRLVRRFGPAIISRTVAWSEDKSAAFYYHREGRVFVPADTPAGTYDLEIEFTGDLSGRPLSSPHSVTVVQEFPTDPLFLSWGHLDTWGQYQAEYLERLVAVANVIGPDMVLISNEANPAYAAGALRRLDAPFVINFGNHRGPEPGPWFGDPVGAVDFGDAFTVVNFGRSWDRGTADVEALLAARVRIPIKVLNSYEANVPVAELLDRYGIRLLHYAHGPGPAVASMGATPTVRVGKSNSESFRVIRFQDGRPKSFTYRGHATAPWPAPRGARAPVGVTYEKANEDGGRSMTAHFYNDLEESFTAARAVFVLSAGAYRARGGRVESSVLSDDRLYVVVSVRFDLPAKGTGSIVVGP